MLENLSFYEKVVSEIEILMNKVTKKQAAWLIYKKSVKIIDKLLSAKI